MKKLWDSITTHLKEAKNTFRFIMNMDMSVTEDPHWFLGTKTRPETVQRLKEAKERADSSQSD